MIDERLSQKDAEATIETNIRRLFDSAELLAAKSFYGPAIHLMMAAREESVKWMLVHCWEFLERESRSKIFRHDFKHEKAGIFHFLSGKLQALDFAVGALELLRERENDPEVREATSVVIEHLPTVLSDDPKDLAEVITKSLYSMSDNSGELRLKQQLKDSIDASEKLRLNSIYVDFDQELGVKNDPGKLQVDEYKKIRSDVLLAKFHIDKLAGRNPDKSELYSAFPDWKHDLEKSLADLAKRLAKERT
ncbi:AbiV family abortive infection protein [Bradyrhizobium xenonodulans]|uniref:AbiV family abortive infection protein n=1 Tax=Bradyrhizobium xenonodulans TaxID=2736875 RepID=A0ABY7MZ46_9BRAD|nr:AbiV family abortive infection protein [Bradyrhizobium xenonodulans]WBL82788.1 AbiV family abortive infection protein [Bradyrhizobium xenonodulans]